MNYKTIIKSRNMRIKIMRLLSFLPDRSIIKLEYKLKTGKKLNLNNPQRYTEKLQWYKLFYRDPIMGNCVDKYSVREYIAESGYADILIPLIGIYNSAEEIDFNILPQSFVVKDTLGGGGNAVIIVKDKKLVDWGSLKKAMNSWTKPNYGKHPGREWVYDNKKSRIMIESYVASDPKEGGLIDYKFFCFNGKVNYVYGIADRILGSSAGFGIFDRDFNLLPYRRADEKPLKRKIPKPNNYDDMVKCAERLSSRFPHARIDLYDQNNKIQFGEITFFDGSGYMSFEPDEFDFIMGRQFVLPERNYLK